MDAKALTSASNIFCRSPNCKIISFKGHTNVVQYRRAGNFQGRHCGEINKLRSSSNSIFVKTSSKFQSLRQSSSNSDSTTNDNDNRNNFEAVFEVLLKGLSPQGRRHVLAVKFFRGLTAVVVVLLALGFIPFQRRAFAVPAAVAAWEKNSLQEKKNDSEISEYEKQLNEAVKLLQERLKQLQAKGKDKTEAEVQGQVQKVEEALELIRQKSLSMRSKALLYTEARRMREQEAKLIKEVENTTNTYLAAKRMVEDADGDEQLKERSEKKFRDAEKSCRKVWSKLTRLEADLVAMETEGFQLALKNIPAIRLEGNAASTSEYQDFTKESIAARIWKDLEHANQKTQERLFLPSMVDVEEPQLPMDAEKRKLVERIKIESQKSREMQEHLDDLVRNQFKGAGEEKHLLVVTPQEEVVKGLPPVESKWLFGDKEVYVPGAASFQMAQGWKKWRDEAKANLKKKLLEDVELGRKYVAERQARVLLYRDRVMAKTWYNEIERRWEMEPIAASYAVTKELVGRARIRDDWAVMYIVLKGDDREYYVDIQVFDALFEHVGGFDALYVKMVTSAIPTTVEMMWIPLKELNWKRQIRIAATFCYIAFKSIWKSRSVSFARDWYFMRFRLIFERYMVQYGFRDFRRLVGQRLDESAWFMEWRILAERRVKKTFKTTRKERRRRRNRLRKGISPGFDEFIWFMLGLSVRFLFYAYPLIVVFRFLHKQFSGVYKLIVPDLCTPAETAAQTLRNNLIFYKPPRAPGEQTVFVPGIEGAFDRMKRIKNPPLRLKDLPGNNAIKDEVNEVVTFLKNPKRFQELGARPPRGVIITGGIGTGKTSLALAIAAEAKVPVVRLRRSIMTGGRYVGEGPAKVRELFQTAREVAPVILFMDDFDKFIGSRGKSNTTDEAEKNKQDSEAAINQMLVELDGFEAQDGVVFIATATNLDLIDNALRRPGRMDRIIDVSLPNEEEREAILRSAAKLTMHDGLYDFVDWHKVAEKTAGYIPPQLICLPQSIECSAFTTKIGDPEELFSIYGWLATIGGITPHWLKHSKLKKMLDEALIDRLGLRLTKEEIHATVESMIPYDSANPGLELRSPPTIWTRQFKFPHAVWAAGRGLLAFLLPNFDSVDRVWLDPTSWRGVGFTKLTSQRGGMEDEPITRSYLEKKLVLCFGSYVAARLLLPVEENSNLSTMEIEEAQEIATRMVLEYGWGPDDNPMVYWTSTLNLKASVNTGKDYKLKLEAKIEKLFYRACDKAAELLHKNRTSLDALLEHLLECDCASKQDILRILEANGAIQESEPFMLINHKNYEFAACMSTNGTGRISATPQSATSGF